MHAISRANPFSLGALFALALALSLGIGSLQAHAATLYRQLQVGSTGSDVSSLQAYLATNASIYPEGLVTGYYGSLTEAAVERFQTAQGIVTSGTPATTGYGRVGPLTLARLNSLMGGVVQTGNGLPSISPPSIQVGNTSATFSFSSNEPTQGQVYWDTNPIVANEATGPGQVPFISGTLATDSGSLNMSHTITAATLQPNTTYYYVIRVIDANTGITITWPPGTFHTGG
jgi:peptidoglycan hydrolase-like protein with peptidoglycan-binding domain